MLAGAETVYDINQTLRPHQPLLTALGYQQCADQSVIQQTRIFMVIPLRPRWGVNFLLLL
jgi:hypothetical protein